MTMIFKPLRADRRRALGLVLGSGLATGLGLIGPGPAWGASARVQGAGATFPSKVYARWAADYARQTGVDVRYQPTGSGNGIEQATRRSVDFAGSDVPLGPDALGQKRLVQIPTCVGGVVPVVNGFEPDRLRLTGEVLAAIFAGDIQRWDDARIAALNPGLSLPARRIVRVVRGDKSGSTEGLTRYLAGQSPAFAKQVGEGVMPAWPGEPLRAEGNDGMSALVRATPGAIGYVSYDRVVADGLAGVRLRNREGRWVAASEAGFRAAILHSPLYRDGSDTASLMDMPGPDSWPLTMTTFVLLDAAPATAAAVEPAMRFLYWCFLHGDALTQGTGFAPLPTAVQARLTARFAQVKPRDGQFPHYLSF